MKIRGLLTALVIMLVHPVLAEGDTQGPRWEYYNLGYVSVDIDGVSDTPTGAQIGGSVFIDGNILLMGNYTATSVDVSGFDTHLDTTSIGLGYVINMSDQTGLMLGVSYLSQEVCFKFSGEQYCSDEDGFGVTGGLSTRLTEKLELGLFGDYWDVSDSTAGRVNANYYFSKDFAVGVSYSQDTDIEIVALNAKFAF